MVLTEKEMNVIKDLQTQEQSCVEKYKKYGEQAKDQELKNLFGRLQKRGAETFRFTRTGLKRTGSLL